MALALDALVPTPGWLEVDFPCWQEARSPWPSPVTWLAPSASRRSALVPLDLLLLTLQLPHSSRPAD
jgi:hypothetical protein